MAKKTDGDILSGDDYTNGTQIHEEVSSLPATGDVPTGQIVYMNGYLYRNEGSSWKHLTAPRPIKFIYGDWENNDGAWIKSDSNMDKNGRDSTRSYNGNYSWAMKFSTGNDAGANIRRIIPYLPEKVSCWVYFDNYDSGNDTARFRFYVQRIGWDADDGEWDSDIVGEVRRTDWDIGDNTGTWQKFEIVIPQKWVGFMGFIRFRVAEGGSYDDTSFDTWIDYVTGTTTYNGGTSERGAGNV